MFDSFYFEDVTFNFRFTYVAALQIYKFAKTTWLDDWQELFSTKIDFPQ